MKLFPSTSCLERLCSNFELIDHTKTKSPDNRQTRVAMHLSNLNLIYFFNFNNNKNILVKFETKLLLVKYNYIRSNRSSRYPNINSTETPYRTLASKVVQLKNSVTELAAIPFGFCGSYQSP